MSLANRIAALALAGSFVLPGSAFAVGGDLVPHYGTLGRVSTPMHTAGTAISRMRTDAAGNHYLARWFEWSIPQSTLAGGTVILGTSLVGVTKLDANGALVTGFGFGGSTTLRIGTDPSVSVSDMLILADGRILLAGETSTPGAIDPSKCWLARLNANGLVDTTFGTGGQFELASSSGAACSQPHLAMASGGQVLVGFRGNVDGSGRPQVVRLNADGSLDTAFGTSGYGTPTYGSIVNFSGLAVNAAGEILAAGQTSIASNGGYFSTWYVFRFTAAGAPSGVNDPPSAIFAYINDFPKADQPFHIRGLVLQTDGKPVLVGWGWNGFDTDFYLLRVTTTGAIDTTYSGDGRVFIPMNVNDQPTAFWRDASNNITVAGYTGVSNVTGIARVTSAGVLDSGFGTGGKLFLDIQSGTAIQDSAGRFVTAFSTQVRRFLGTGATDTAFGSGGTTTLARPTTTATIQALARQSTGRIVASGWSQDAFQPQAILVRYDVSNTLNTFFGDDSQDRILLGMTEAPALAMQPDNKIVVAGTRIEAGTGRQTWGVYRFGEHGATDTTFGGTPAPGTTTLVPGTGNAMPKAMALQADGKIVIAGHAYSGTKPIVAVARLNPDGSPDTTFDADGIALTDFASSTGAYGRHVTIQSDGRIVVAGIAIIGGVTQVAAVRYNTNGSLDTTFDGDGKILTAAPAGWFAEARGVAQAADGRLVIAASFDQAGGGQFALIKYLANGALDASFGTGGIATRGVGGGTLHTRGMAMLPSGKFLVGGEAGLPGGAGSAFALFTANGAVDPGVGTNGLWTASDPAGTSTEIATLLLLPDGKVVTGGTTSTDGAASYELTWRYGDGGAIAFTAATASFAENAGAVTATVTRTGGTSGPMQVDFAIASGTATFTTNCCGGGLDAYGLPTGTLFWPDGAGGDRTIPFTIYNDALGEPDETFTITLSGAGLGTPAVQTVTIVSDDDTTPNAFFFVDLSGAARSTVMTSNAVTITGINTPAPISVTGGTYSIGCNGTFTATAGTISNGQAVCVRHTSSASFGTATSTTLTVGGVSDTFTTTTAVGYALTVSQTGGVAGLVTSTPAGVTCGVDCSETFANGTGVTLVASSSDPRLVFTQWSGACTGTAPVCIVTMSQARNVTAHFVYRILLPVYNEGGGTIASQPAGIDCGPDESDCEALFLPGTQVTLTATALPGGKVASLTGSACTGQPVCQVTVTASDEDQSANMLTRQVAFLTPLTVTKAGTGSGTVATAPASELDCGATCTIARAPGTSVTLVATAAPGSTFAGWSGGGCTGTGTCVATFTTSVTAVTATFTASAATRGDVNGDGKADLFWREAAPGQGLSWWTMNGATATAANYHAVGSEWQVADVGDLDGDGNADLLWRRMTDGANYLWTLDGFAFKGFFDLGILDPAAWSLVGAADLDGDGKDDIVWRGTDGTVYAWLMNGGVIASQGVIGNPGTQWVIADLADMNGDGKSDIVFRNSSDGGVYIYFMSGLAIASGGYVGAVDPVAWTLVGAADFSGDGKADFLWRHSSGDTWVWLMNGASFVGAGGIGNPGAGWSVRAFGDFDGDGHADLVWRHTDGTTYLWRMEGAGVLAYLPVANPGGAWDVVAP
jgi:uncharacterized delta-60 repeat protein